MKKTNNRFRTNSGAGYGNGYSLNYKFDSISIAGKNSGTALDLIRKYNDLAKEAWGNSDHVSAEVFRQYAEHYRKIVSEINEKNRQNKEMAERKKEVENNVVAIDSSVESDKIKVSSKEEKTPSIEEKTQSEQVVEAAPVESAKKEVKIKRVSRKIIAAV